MLYEGIYKLPDECTVFQAEIVAIREAAKYAIEAIDFKYVKFFVDSQAALLALDTPHISSRVVLETRDILNAMAIKGKIVKLVWTRAHVGTEGNERADELAKIGGKLEKASGNIAVPHSITKNVINERMTEKWTDKWLEYPGARMSKLFVTKTVKNKSKYIYKLSSAKLGRLIRVTSGHNNLNYFQNKLCEDISPLCRLCEEGDETFEHWVTECPVLRVQRNEIFCIATNNYILVPYEWEVDKILRFSFLPIIENIIDTGKEISYNNSSLGREVSLEPD